MLYSFAIVPVLITVVIFYAIVTVYKGFLRQDRFYVFCLLAVLGINLFGILIGATISPSNIVYILLLPVLIICFQRDFLRQSFYSLFLWLLVGNVVVCALEIGLGYASFDVPGAHDLYMALSSFLASSGGFMAENYGLIRNIGGLTFVRPVGLFGDIYLSSYMLFVLFGVLFTKDTSRRLCIPVGILLLLTATLQSAFCFVAFLSLGGIGARRNWVLAKIIFIPVVSAMTFFLYSDFISIISMDAEVLLATMMQYFLEAPSIDFIFGHSFLDVVDQIRNLNAGDESILVLEFGLFRYLATFGLLNSLLFIIITGRLLMELRKEGSYYPTIFFISSLATFLHFSMLASIAGLIFTIFSIYILSEVQGPSKSN